jgi:predicted dehydrogenase
LIIGSGSVGQRHARNFAALGCKVTCADPREDRVEKLAGQVTVESTHIDIKKILGEINFYDGVAICSPTAFHVPQAKAALIAQVPVLLEKPVSINAKDAEELLKIEDVTGCSVLMGYTWRWWEALSEVKNILNANSLGSLRHVRFVMSAHLEDWHPWEAISDFFMSSKELGGGALLDESHWIDLMLWFFGKPERVWGRIETIGSLELETDDHVDALFDYSNGLRVSMHLDLYGRPHEKSITFTGEKGSLKWTAEPNEIALGIGANPKWEVKKFDGDRNKMFVGVAQSFIDVINGHKPKNDLVGGIRVMQVIEALRASNTQSCSIEFP